METRCLKEFPSGMDQVFGLRFLDVSGNDIRIISEEDFPSILMEFNVADNLFIYIQIQCRTT